MHYNRNKIVGKAAVQLTLLIALFVALLGTNTSRIYNKFKL